MKKPSILSLGLLVVPLLPLGAFAHHSFAMFDADNELSLTGTVKAYEWTNPHAWLYVTALGADGKLVEWSLEMQGTGQSARTGWKPDSVKPGDKVTVVIHPMKSGARGGQLVAATLPNGQTLGARGAPNNPYGN